MKVTTVAGSPGKEGRREGKEGYRDGKGEQALFSNPRCYQNVSFDFSSAIAADRSGNLYIVDSGNFRIRKLSPDGTVSTLAGAGAGAGFLDGRADKAKLGVCYGVAVGDDGTVYLSDSFNHVIRKVSNGHVTTLAGKQREHGMRDGKGEQARFNYPYGMCIASDGSLLVAEYNNHSIRRVSTDGDVATILANGSGNRDGDLTQAQLRHPQYICTNGDDIYVSSNTTSCVKKISQGMAVSLKINGPWGLTFLNGSLYTVSNNTHSIYEGESFQLIAGTGEKGHRDGAAEVAFRYPRDIVACDGCLYVCDTGNQCIRKVIMFVEWTPSTHHMTSKATRDAVRTLIMMKRRRGNVWNGVPKELIFLVSAEINRIDWDCTEEQDSGQRNEDKDKQPFEQQPARKTRYN